MWRRKDEGDCKRNVAVRQIPFFVLKKTIVSHGLRSRITGSRFIHEQSANIGH